MLLAGIMVNFELSDEQLMLQEMARDFANEEIKPNAASWDRDSIFPREAISKANELGLLTLKIPEKYGGGGMGSFEEVIVLEELGCGDPGFATASGSSMLASYPIITGGTEEQKKSIFEWLLRVKLPHIVLPNLELEAMSRQLKLKQSDREMNTSSMDKKCGLQVLDMQTGFSY